MTRVIGGIVLGVGILIAGASGLCSIVALVSSFNDAGMIPLVLLIGGIPFAIGVGLCFLGRSLLRWQPTDSSGDG